MPRRSTMDMAQWIADTREGASLTFELCKGGYFSDMDEYGLKVMGRTAQNGAPAPEAPVPIQCVKAGTKVRVTDGDDQTICQITVPRDLYEGDIWYPASGKVVLSKYKNVYDGSADESWTMSARGAWIYPFPAMEPNYQSSPYNNSYCDKAVYGYSAYMSKTSGNYFCDSSFAVNLFGETVPTLTAWRAYLAESPVTFVYPLQNAIVEYYAPQPVFAHAGTVHVLSAPNELAPDLSATMLKRRTN